MRPGSAAWIVSPRATGSIASMTMAPMGSRTFTPVVANPGYRQTTRTCRPARRISNRVFDDDDAIIDAACNAWTRLMAQPQTITSIGMRKRAHVGQSK